jgi:hypothetical protein
MIILKLDVVLGICLENAYDYFLGAKMQLAKELYTSELLDGFGPPGRVGRKVL